MDLQANSGRENSIHLSWIPVPLEMKGGFKIISQYNNELQSEQFTQETSFSMPRKSLFFLAFISVVFFSSEP